MDTIIKRMHKTTPKYFKKIRNAGLAIVAIGASILAAPGGTAGDPFTNRGLFSAGGRRAYDLPGAYSFRRYPGHRYPGGGWSRR